jgi:predicted CoA-binding protein
MIDADRILTTAETVLLVDWPSRDVPDTLSRAGYTVLVKGGPAPDDFSAYEVSEGQVVEQRTGKLPTHADLIYAHRPLGELSAIAAMGHQIGAAVLWWQSGLDDTGTRNPHGCWAPADHSQRARSIAEAAGLDYIDDVYIADAVRRLDVHH